MDALTVVGGGLGGLVAAITAAEGGAEVRLYEAHARLGGRWRVSDPPFVFHEGPHVIYRDGPLYPWLRRRGLLGTTRAVPVFALRRFGFRLDGRLRHRPPLDLLSVLIARPPRSTPASPTGPPTGSAPARPTERRRPGCRPVPSPTR